MYLFNFVLTINFYGNNKKWYIFTFYQTVRHASTLKPKKWRFYWNRRIENRAEAKSLIRRAVQQNSWDFTVVFLVECQDWKKKKKNQIKAKIRGKTFDRCKNSKNNEAMKKLSTTVPNWKLKFFQIEGNFVIKKKKERISTSCRKQTCWSAREQLFEVG